MTVPLVGPEPHAVSRVTSEPVVCELLGVQVHPLTVADLHAIIASAIDERRQVIITSQNLHGVYLYHRTEKMRELHRRSFVRIDGMSLVMIGRMLGHPMRREHRVTLVDWINPLMEEAVRRSWRVFYLGSRPGVVEKGATILRHRYPGLQLGAHHGHFNAAPGSTENNKVLGAIADFQPHVLMVGMGMPRQESWVYDNIDELNVDAILTCGAAIDYVAGLIPTPPRWMGRVGLEWFYRLLSEPGRLGFRYLVEPWALLGLLMRDLWKRVAGELPPGT